MQLCIIVRQTGVGWTALCIDITEASNGGYNGLHVISAKDQCVGQVLQGKKILQYNHGNNHWLCVHFFVKLHRRPLKFDGGHWYTFLDAIAALCLTMSFCRSPASFKKYEML